VRKLAVFLLTLSGAVGAGVLVAEAAQDHPDSLSVEAPGIESIPLAKDALG